MSMTLWLHTLQGRDMSRESDDHTLMHDLGEDLDRLCERLGVAPLSSFYDRTDLDYNFAERPKKQPALAGDDAFDEDEEQGPLDPETGYAYGIDDMQWFDAAAGLASLEALREEIEDSDGQQLHLDEEAQDLLLEELDDCIDRLREPAGSGGRFHLAVLM